MIPTELKNIEMKLDREKLEEQKNKEQFVKNKLEKMQPCIPYRRPFGMLTLLLISLGIDLGTNYK
jgi:hypothetical protein